MLSDGICNDTHKAEAGRLAELGDRIENRCAEGLSRFWEDLRDEDIADRKNY